MKFNLKNLIRNLFTVKTLVPLLLASFLSVIIRYTLLIYNVDILDVVNNYIYSFTSFVIIGAFRILIRYMIELYLQELSLQELSNKEVMESYFQLISKQDVTLKIPGAIISYSSGNPGNSGIPSGSGHSSNFASGSGTQGSSQLDGNSQTGNNPQESNNNQNMSEVFHGDGFTYARGYYTISDPTFVRFRGFYDLRARIPREGSFQPYARNLANAMAHAENRAGASPFLLIDFNSFDTLTGRFIIEYMVHRCPDLRPERYPNRGDLRTLLSRLR